MKFKTEAIVKANELAKKYNVTVEILPTDNDYFADAALQRTAIQKHYFISNEDIEFTGKATEHLIRIDKSRTQHLAKLANAPRISKANEHANKVSGIIADYQKLYMQEHGRPASLPQIAEHLNALEVPTPRGGNDWHATTVKRIIDRASEHQR